MSIGPPGVPSSGASLVPIGQQMAYRTGLRGKFALVGESRAYHVGRGQQKDPKPLGRSSSIH